MVVYEFNFPETIKEPKMGCNLRFVKSQNHSKILD